MLQRCASHFAFVHRSCLIWGLWFRLHKEVEAYVNYISPTPVEDEIRGLVVQLVSKAITTVYKDAQVRAFGSFGTKLYLPQGCAALSLRISALI